MSEEKKAETPEQEPTQQEAPQQEAPKQEEKPAAETKTAEAKPAAPLPKIEKPSVCAKCGKTFTRKNWYYRNGKHYCNKRCWRATKAVKAKDDQEK